MKARAGRQARRAWVATGTAKPNRSIPTSSRDNADALARRSHNGRACLHAYSTRAWAPIYATTYVQKRAALTRPPDVRRGETGHADSSTVCITLSIPARISIIAAGAHE